MIFNKKQKGETLIEVITALTALVLAGMASVTVIISVMHSNAISKEYLIAQNLAREGIEGVISIRNTNWLKYPSNKTSKWLCLDPQDDTCGNIATTTGKYILNRTSLEGGFYLYDTGTDPLNLSVAPPDDDFDLKLKDFTEVKLYTHDNEGQITNPTFYRMITFEQVNSDPNKFKVTVTMQWFTKSQVNTYELTSIITNYAK